MVKRGGGNYGSVKWFRQGIRESPCSEEHQSRSGGTSCRPLGKLAVELRKRTQVEVSVLSLDISLPDCAETLERELYTRGITPEISVNNAAFGLSGEFLIKKPHELKRCSTSTFSA